MENLPCGFPDAHSLGSFARDICSFPLYSYSPYYNNILTPNSSSYLNYKYETVQSFLKPSQQQDFTQSLRKTFGQKGEVFYGSVGVVALSLVVFFDTVSRQVKKEYLSNYEPIPGMFLKDPRGYYPPSVHTVSEYVRLVPHIANNPKRMREETERYMKQLMLDDQAFEQQWLKMKQDDVTVINHNIGKYFTVHLYAHLNRLTNATVADEAADSARKQMEEKGKLNRTDVIAALKERFKTYDPSTFFDSVNFNLNCDPEAASREFQDEIKKSSKHIQDSFKRCESEKMEASKTWLHYIAELNFLYSLNSHSFILKNFMNDLIAQRGDFNLKSGAQAKWSET